MINKAWLKPQLKKNFDGWPDQTRLTNRLLWFADWSLSGLCPFPIGMRRAGELYKHFDVQRLVIKTTLCDNKCVHPKYHHVISCVGKQAMVSPVSNDDIGSLGQVGQATGHGAVRSFSYNPGFQPRILLAAASS